jgi:2-C-methyl-D-erythritol 2,4-cyclodiphosphate synthase
MRIGYGFDSHSFKRGLPLKLGGVTIPHSQGLAGHSDGDVLLHALTDALLGAIAAGDIGTHFPPSQPKWKGADSARFVREALRLVRRAGYAVANVDSTLVLAQPRIGPHAARIQGRVAELLNIKPSAVGIKAKTPEGLPTQRAALAHVVVLLEKKAKRGGRLAEEAEAVPQPEIDSVVKRVLEEVASSPGKKARAQQRRP